MRPAAPWSILDVDLNQAISEFAPPIDKPALVLLRFHGAVLGKMHVLPADLPMTAAEFAEEAGRVLSPTVVNLLALGLEDSRMTPASRSPNRSLVLTLNEAVLTRLEELIAKRRARPVPVDASIVICTRHRPAALAECLTSISEEIEAKREVIVVDNGPDPETAAVVKRFGGVRYVAEPVPGLNRARNAGIDASTCDVAVFIDDDVRPEPGWVEPLLQRFDSPDVAVVCGLVLPETLETDAQIAFEYELGFGGMKMLPIRFESRFLEGWKWGVPISEVGAGANMAVRCSIARQLRFDERVGAGVAGGCGDDTEFWHHALHTGHVIYYEPLSVVRHQHRRSWKELERQAYGYGTGSLVQHFAAYAQRGSRSDLMRILRLFRWYSVQLLRILMRQRTSKPPRIVLNMMYGYLIGFRHIGLAFRSIPKTAHHAERRHEDAAT